MTATGRYKLLSSSTDDNNLAQAIHRFRCLPRWWCRLNYLDILIPPLCVCLPAYSPQKAHSCFVTSSLTTRWITKTFSPSIRYLRSFSVSQQQCRGLIYSHSSYLHNSHTSRLQVLLNLTYEHRDILVLVAKSEKNNCKHSCIWETVKTQQCRASFRHACKSSSRSTMQQRQNV